MANVVNPLVRRGGVVRRGEFCTMSFADSSSRQSTLIGVFGEDEPFIKNILIALRRNTLSFVCLPGATSV